ncbi:hypothetical protein J4448_06440 [Candidatus Woesearchaeota archaeon]|nr:hypothetical protein [Candidatus Woesearchaeota archaeon]
MASSTILTATTLADRIKMDFSKVKLKKAAVKVPKLKVRKRKVTSLKSDDKIPISSIINILIKTAVEKSKSEKKEKVVGKDKSYNILKDDKSLIANGGYGTVSKGYRTTPHSSYIDYEKLFSYLGKFKSQSAYENMGSHLETLNKATESGSFVLADRDSMDKIGRFDKYMKTPVMAIQTMALSLVPIAGLSSAEWEEIKNLMRFDSVMYTLKSKTS